MHAWVCLVFMHVHTPSTQTLPPSLPPSLPPFPPYHGTPLHLSLSPSLSRSLAHPPTHTLIHSLTHSLTYSPSLSPPPLFNSLCLPAPPPHPSRFLSVPAPLVRRTCTRLVRADLPNLARALVSYARTQVEQPFEIMPIWQLCHIMARDAETALTSTSSLRSMQLAAAAGDPLP